MHMWKFLSYSIKFDPDLDLVENTRARSMPCHVHGVVTSFTVNVASNFVHCTCCRRLFHAYTEDDVHVYTGMYSARVNKQNPGRTAIL